MSGFKQVTRAQARSHLSRDERIALMERTVRDLETTEDFVAEISRLWHDAQTAFLAIGRYLVQAQQKLRLADRQSRSQGDDAGSGARDGTGDKTANVQTFQAFVEHHLPFGYQVAYQLRMVAEAVDGQRLRVEELPSSYATAYQFTTLSDADLARARQSEPPVLRPTVKRQEVVDFKRQLAQERSAEVAVMPAREAARLRRRHAVLVAQKERLLAELATIESQLSGQCPSGHSEEEE